MLFDDESLKLAEQGNTRRSPKRSDLKRTDSKTFDLTSNNQDHDNWERQIVIDEVQSNDSSVEY